MSRDIIDEGYRFKYLPTQLNVLKAVECMDFPNIMYCGGFGSGKTRLLGEIALELMIIYPKIQIGVFRKTRTGVFDTTYKTFIDEVLPPEYIRRGGHKISTLEITIRGGGYSHFFGIDNFERKASLNFDVILVDEATELEEADVIMLQGRLRGKVIPVPQIVFFCNPGPPGGWFYTHFPANAELPDGKRDDDYVYYHTTSFENTNNPEAYLKRLRKWEGTQYYRRYVLGLWTAFEGQVWPDYEPKRHLIAPFEIPAHWPKSLGVDFGYEDPIVLLWIATKPETGQQFVYRQYYHIRVLCKKAVEIARRVTEHARETIDDIIGDHDAENRAQFEEYWMPTMAAKKDIVPGIQAVAEKFQNNELFIFDNSWMVKEGFWYGNLDPDPILIERGAPTCLQDEIPLFMWSKNDKPKKENDHACDALRYKIFTEIETGGRGIEVFRSVQFARQ